MRIYLSLLALLLFQALGCAHLQEGRDKGFADAFSTDEALEQSFAPRRIAVVIGVSDYDDPTFDDLKHADRDAMLMARSLEDPKYGAFDEVLLLNRPERTHRKALLSELRRLRNELRRQDTVVFYFSGHGTIAYEADGLHLYLVATDTRAADLRYTAIDLADLRQYLASLRPQRQVLILDNCFSGLGKSRLSAVARQSLEAAEAPWDAFDQSIRQSEAILMASTLGGVAKEDDRLKSGVYTYHLIHALTTEAHLADTNRDGAISTWEAHDFARIKTMEHTGGQQIPEGFFRMIGRAEMYLSGQVDPQTAQQAALVYAYGADVGPHTRIEVDGRHKGIFPQTVSIAPGPRKIVVRDELGRSMAEGRLTMAPGQVYSLELLLQELQGYRRYFGVRTGLDQQFYGPADLFWGQNVPKFSVVSGYRVRGGAFRGLSMSFDMGLQRAVAGEWAEIPGIDEEKRLIWEGGLSLSLRRGTTQFQVGGGIFTTATYIPVVDRDDPALEGVYSSHSWITLGVGPLLWQGYHLGNNLWLVAEERLQYFSIDPREPGAEASNLKGMFTLGLELGF